MSKVLLAIAATLIGPLSGLVTTRLMDWVDNVKGWTNKLPDSAKQAIVMGLAVIIPYVNAQWGLQLPTDLAGLLSEPSLQSIVAVVLAFILKGHKQTAVAAAAAARKP